jgi:hypothetical protein
MYGPNGSLEGVSRDLSDTRPSPLITSIAGTGHPNALGIQCQLVNLGVIRCIVGLRRTMRAYVSDFAVIQESCRNSTQMSSICIVREIRRFRLTVERPYIQL